MKMNNEKEAEKKENKTGRENYVLNLGYEFYYEVTKTITYIFSQMQVHSNLSFRIL